MGHKLLALLVATWLIITCVIPISAEEFDYGKTGSITVTLTEQTEKTPIAGARLSVYYIASVGINTAGNLNYILTEEFSGLGIALEDPEITDKLDAYLCENAVPAIQLCTDENGIAVCENQPLGLYFIRQTNTVEGFAPCTPFLVTVPMKNEDGYVYAVNAAPKTEVAKLTSITIRKVWNTDASTKAADSVTVELLRNDKVVQTAILDAGNHWQVTYTDMPESDAYTIQEVNVPGGFTATYRQNGYVFTVTNTSTLIQTGQLLWPIPLLAVIGMLLIGLGVVLLQKKRHING